MIFAFLGVLRRLTDLQYTFVVTDTQTGAVRSYTKQTGTYDGRADTSAFVGN